MDVNIGKGLTLAVDVNALPANVMEHVVRIGLRNILMDAHASITKETNPDDFAAASEAVALKKLDAMLRGEVRTTATREGDPVRAEAMRLATAAVMAAIKRAGKKVGKDGDYTTAQLREAAGRYLEKNPAILETARANVETARAGVDDLDGII
jgi:hypothetical protein